MTNFTYLRLLAGFPDRKSAASFCGVSERTVRNWEKHGAPKAIVKLMTMASSDLSWIDKRWQGFRFYKGTLITDTNYPIYPGDLRAFPYLVQTAKAQRPCDAFPGQTNVCPLKACSDLIIDDDSQTDVNVVFP